MNVKKFRCEESGVYSWVHNGSEYCTNKYGEGIWQLLKSGAWLQVVGTCDFVLSGYSLSGARKKVNRWFN